MPSNICQDIECKKIFINPSLDVIINSFAKVGQIPSICSQDTELNENSDVIQGP